MKIKCLNEEKRRQDTIYTILQVGFVFLILKKLKKYIQVTPSPSPSPQPTPPTPPGPPLPEAPDVNLTDIGTDTITVNWTPDPNADSYNIERSLDGVNFTFIANVLAPQLSFIDIAPPLTPNTTYYYRVNGQNTTGQGPFSAIVSGTTLPIPPGPPSTWTSVAIPGTTNWNEIVSNNGSTWMATAGSFGVANKLLSTNNGATWSALPIVLQHVSNAITFFSFSSTSRFLCLSNLTNRAYYTDDSGTTWTQSNVLPDAGGNTYTSVCYGNNIVIGVRSSKPASNFQIVKSANQGVDWGGVGDPTWNVLNLQSVCYGEPIVSSVTTPRFVSISTDTTNNQTAVYSNTDGSSWTLVSIPATSPVTNIFWRAVCYGSSGYVAVGNTNPFSNCYVTTSVDGSVWTVPIDTGVNGFWNSVNFGNGFYVAVSNANTASLGTGQIIYSSDGITWTPADAPTFKAWNHVAYSSGTGRWIAIDTDAAMVCDV
jgi:hypothetical protein